MAGWEGFGARLKEAMLEKGFVNRRGEPDVMRLALTCGWIPNYLYRYLNDHSAPDRENLERLAKDLDVNPAWLLFGNSSGVDKTPARPTRRGARKLTCLVAALGLTLSGLWSAAPVKADHVIDNSPSYRRWRRASRRLTDLVTGWGPGVPTLREIQVHAGLA